MKKRIQIIVIFLITISGKTFSQDLIKDFPGIPVRAGLDWSWIDQSNPNIPSYNLDSILTKMKEMGVDIFQLDVRRASILDTIIQKGFKIIMPINSPTHAWIRYYTDAKYSVWEAEGTPPNISEAMLEHNSDIMEQVDSGGISYLRLKPSAVAYRDSELIRGPYYQQEVLYYTTESNSSLIDTVQYTATFRLKLERNVAYQDTITPENMNDTICVIQVTQSRYTTDSTVAYLSCTYVIDSLPITRWMFNQLNSFQSFNLNYDLKCDSCSSNPVPPAPKSYVQTYNGTEQIQARWLREYIQFKVIWLGNPNYLLSIDKVIVSDVRGREFKEPFQFPTVISRLHSQDNELSSHHNDITGWLGIDEPYSIDNFEPIRVVDSVLSAKSNLLRPVWFDLISHWDGVWEAKNNRFGVMHLSP